MNERRKFIKSIGRGLLLAGLTGMSGYLLWRGPGDGACGYDFICSKCRRHSSCQLQEAEEYRKENNIEQTDDPEI